ncbi:UDP-glycosyltransferase UGT5-like [Neodiprion fabricii]|uniref:UDP-glycosyltransferase UGT5-like n=1 Tax=Neodiprion fabricii TaxID=2872261 RepID=UPI001ED8E18D|nr:UDP-glycosyltransferase UGT5-like [Neodiprion fabricii]
MTGKIIALAALIFFMSILHRGNASRILCVFPSASVSHQVVFRGLTLALRERGHDLVVVTPNPVRDPNLKNYTEIDVSFLYEENYETDYIELRRNACWIDWFWNVAPILHLFCEKTFDHPEFKKIYAPDSGEEFDLMLTETLYWPAFLALGKRFDVPIIGMTSLGLALNLQYSVGNPILTSHQSNWDLAMKEVSDSPTLFERLKNFYNVWKFIYNYNTEFMPAQHAIAKKYFGNEIPELGEIERNLSLIFTNQQGPISYLRPNVPNVIEIGNFHVSKKIKPLSKDLQKTLDESKQGFIYMSLGSNVKSTMLDKKSRSEFIAAFSKLPYTVIWKFEDEFLPGKPDNVIIIKWAPQQAILAHPNLKAFVYQGGLQSTEEAISHGVPVIGFPVMADQDMNVNKMVSLGVGKKLEITDVKRDDLIEAIQSVATDGSYKQRMLNLRELLKDRPYDSLKNAVWWTEHVIRHRGVPHLRSSTADEPWYQRGDMDVIFLIAAAFVISVMTASAVLYQLLVYSMKIFGNQQSVNRKEKLK